jgi:hypothetical protein
MKHNTNTQIKAVEFIKDFYFGTKSFSRMLAGDNISFEKSGTALLIIKDGTMYEVPLAMCVLQLV